jgi:hypothetical protein
MPAPLNQAGTGMTLISLSRTALPYSYMAPAGTDHRIGSILDQIGVSARSSGSKRILEVVYFAVLFWGRAATGE